MRFGEVALLSAARNKKCLVRYRSVLCADHLQSGVLWIWCRMVVSGWEVVGEMRGNKTLIRLDPFIAALGFLENGYIRKLEYL